MSKFLAIFLLTLNLIVYQIAFTTEAKADRFDDAGQALNLTLRSCLAGSLVRYSGSGGLNIANALRGKAVAEGSFERLDVIDLIPGLGGQLKAEEADKVRTCMDREREFIFCQFKIYCRGQSYSNANPVDTCQILSTVKICLKTQDIKVFGSRLNIPITVESMTHLSGLQYKDGGGYIFTNDGQVFKQNKGPASKSVYDTRPFSDSFQAILENPNEVSELMVEMHLSGPEEAVIVFDEISLR